MTLPAGSRASDSSIAALWATYLKFWIYEAEVLYYLSSENFLAFAKSSVSHDAAQIMQSDFKTLSHLLLVFI